MKRILFFSCIFIGSLYGAQRPITKLTPIVALSSIIAVGVANNSSTHDGAMPKSSVRTIHTITNNQEYPQIALFNSIATSNGSLYEAIATYSRSVAAPGVSKDNKPAYTLAFEHCLQQLLAMNIHLLAQTAQQDSDTAYEEFKKLLAVNLMSAHDCAQDEAHCYRERVLKAQKNR